MFFYYEDLKKSDLKSIDSLKTRFIGSHQFEGFLNLRLIYPKIETLCFRNMY